MKRLIWIGAVSFLLQIVFCASVLAMNFEKMSNKQLFEMQGAIQNAPEADQKAYQLEWDKRLAAMNEEEKQQFTRKPEEDKGEDTLPQPKIPARGYEKDEQGLVIFGGFPESKASGQ